MKLLVVIFLISVGLTLNDARPKWALPELPSLLKILNKNVIASETLKVPAIPGQAQTKTFRYISVNERKFKHFNFM